MIADKITIANQFNTYFSSIGTKLAPQIPANQGKSFTDYLHSPVNNVNFKFKLIDIENTVNIIDGLKTNLVVGKTDYKLKCLSKLNMKCLAP